MPYPFLEIAGVTSTDADFIPPVSRAEQLISDSRVTDWWIALDSAAGSDITKSGSEILTMVNRKTGRNPLAKIGTGPSIANVAAFNGKRAAQFADSADRRMQQAALQADLSGVFSMMIVAASGKQATEMLVNYANPTTQIQIQSTYGGSSPFPHFVQAFRGAAGITIDPGVNGLDVQPHLMFVCYDGSALRGAVAMRAEAGSNSTAVTAPGTGSPLYIGGNNAGASLLAGALGTVAIMQGTNIFAVGNADLRQLWCDWASNFYGAGVL